MLPARALQPKHLPHAGSALDYALSRCQTRPMRGTLRKRGTTWTLQYSVADTRPGREGKRRHVTRGGFRTKKDAAAALAEALATVDEREHVEPSRELVNDYLTAWAGSLSGRKPATVKHHQRMVAYYLVPELGGIRLRDLSPTDISRAYARLRERGLAEGTVHHAHVTLNRALSDAVEEGLLARSPMARLPKRLRPTQGRRKEMSVWSADEVQRFLTAAEGDRLYALFRLVLATGMRRAEVCGLRWADVDLDAGPLSVRRGRVAVDYEVAEGEPKSNRARTVGLGPATVAALRAHRRRQLEERMAWGEAWTDSGLVFTAEDGTGLHPQSLRAVLRRLATAAGVPVVAFHNLRHCAATHALANGVPVKVVSDMLGHASTSITEDVYAHVLPHQQDSAAAVADSFLGGSAVNPLSSSAAGEGPK